MPPRGTVVKERIRKRALREGLEISDVLVDQLSDYFGILWRWNQRMNLTGFANQEAGVDRLLIEPLIAAKHLPVRVGCVVDIGSGGGSPAIPMKLAVPELSLLMVESKTRKAAFLREAVRHLKLANVEVETERFETLLSRPEWHEAHDVLTVRALPIEGHVLRGLQAFVKPEGVLFLFRGRSGAQQPGQLEPPLKWHGTYPLVRSLGSRLVVLRKQAVGSSR